VADRSEPSMFGSARAPPGGPRELMVLATIRSSEAMPTDHPLKAFNQDLLMPGFGPRDPARTTWPSRGRPNI